MSQRPDAGGERPALRVVRGNPTAAELAALVTVLAATMGERDAAAPAGRTSAWADRARRLRRPLPHGRDAWRRDGLPG